MRSVKDLALLWLHSYFFTLPTTQKKEMSTWGFDSQALKNLTLMVVRVVCRVFRYGELKKFLTKINFKNNIIIYFSRKENYEMIDIVEIHTNKATY